MITRYIPQASTTACAHALYEVAASKEVGSVLVCIADGSNVEPEKARVMLADIEKPIIGGIFPELIADGQRRTEGILIVGLSYGMQTEVVDLSTHQADDLQERTQQLFRGQDLLDKSLIVLVDAFADEKPAFIEQLYNHFGIMLNYFGGGAGSLSFVRKPVVFTNSGVYENAAVLALIDKELPLGVAHGWEPISESLKVTQTDGKKVISLNWEPAFEVYKRIVEEHSGKKFNDKNFFDIAKSYPLGMAKLEAETVVRDPIAHEGPVMVIVDEVPEGEFVQVMHAKMSGLIKGAEKARNKALEKGMGTNPFCVDCISRVLFMQDEFSQEIEQLAPSGTLNGVLSIGEIANSGDNFLEIYNKTVVVTQL